MTPPPVTSSASRGATDSVFPKDAARGFAETARAHYDPASPVACAYEAK